MRVILDFKFFKNNLTLQFGNANKFISTLDDFFEEGNIKNKIMFVVK